MEEVEQLVPAVGLVRQELVLVGAYVFWLVSEHLWVGRDREPSGLWFKLQVPSHGHRSEERRVGKEC